MAPIAKWLPGAHGRQRTVLGGKIDRATVTEADTDTDGSITIDRRLMEAANIVPDELVHVWNVTSGERLTTYARPADADSGVICLNGAAAHRVRAGQKVVIAAFVELRADDIAGHRPRVVLVDDDNRIREGS